MTLEGWEYRKSHQVTFSSAASYYYAIIKVHRSDGTDDAENVYVGTKCKTDFGDIRFTRSDGTTLLSHFIHEIDSGVAEIYVKVLNTGYSPITIYLYYGNTSASDTSSSSIFTFFEDFSGTGLDTSVWNEPSGYSISDSEITLTSGYLRSISTRNSLNIAFFGSIPNVADSILGLYYSEFYQIRFRFDGTNYLAQTINGGIYQTTTTTLGSAYTGEHKWSIERSGTSYVKFFIDDVLVATHTTNVSAYNMSINAVCAGGSFKISRVMEISAFILPNSVWGTEEEFTIAAFSASSVYGQIPLSVQFTDASLHSPTSWSWNFGDGTTSTEQNPSHTYTSVGKYTVSLTVSNANGSHTLTKTEYITVADIPDALFTSDVRVSKTVPHTVKFTDTSKNYPTSWLWNFGDGSTSTEQNPTHTYTSLGIYTVSLTVTNSFGSDTITKTDYIYLASEVQYNNRSWLDGWRYRKKISFNTNSTDESVVLSFFVHRTWGTDNETHVYVGKKCTKNYGDIRFTDYKNDPVPSTVIWWNQHTSEIKVKINGNLPFLYMYYGGPTDLHANDIEDVVQICDNLNNLTERWTQSPAFDYVQASEGISPYGVVINTTYTITYNNSLPHSDYEIGLIVPFYSRYTYDSTVYSLGVVTDDNTIRLLYGPSSSHGIRSTFYSHINGTETLGYDTTPASDPHYPVLLKIRKTGSLLKMESLIPYFGNQLIYESTFSDDGPIIPEIRFRVTASGSNQPFMLHKFYLITPVEISDISIGNEESVSFVNSLNQWRFSKKINITTSTPLSNHVISFILHRVAGTDTNTDIYLGAEGSQEFRDILIYDNAGNKLPFYIEEWVNPMRECLTSGVRGRIFIKIPTINASSYITIYYGNKDSINESDPSAVFNYYDNFLIHGFDDKLNSSIVLHPNTDLHASEFNTRTGSLGYQSIPSNCCKLIHDSIPLDNVTVRLRVSSAYRNYYGSANVGLCTLDSSNLLTNYLINPFGADVNLSSCIEGVIGTLDNGIPAPYYEGEGNYNISSDLEISISGDSIRLATQNTYSQGVYGLAENNLFQETGHGYFNLVVPSYIMSSEFYGSLSSVTGTISSDIDAFGIIFGSGSMPVIVHDIMVLPYTPQSVVISAETQIVNGSAGKSSRLVAYAPAAISFSLDPETDPTDSNTDSNTPYQMTVNANVSSIVSYHLPGVTSYDKICYLNKFLFICASEQYEAISANLPNLVENCCDILDLSFEFVKGVLNSTYSIYSDSQNRHADVLSGYIYPENSAVLSHECASYYRRNKAAAAAGTGIFLILGSSSGLFDDYSFHYVMLHETLHLHDYSADYHLANTDFQYDVNGKLNRLFEAWGIPSYITNEMILFTTDLFSSRGLALVTYDIPTTYSPSIVSDKNLTYQLQDIEILLLRFSYVVQTDGEVNFSSSISDGVSISWDFGDGTTSTETNPTHIYSDTTAVYRVTLTGTHTSGLVDTRFEYVVLQDTDIIIEKITDIQYAFRFEEDAETWAWNFGDGRSSTSSSPVHLFTAPGTYTISVSAIFEDGSISSDTATVVIPASAFSPIINSITLDSIDQIATKEVTCSASVTQPYAGTITGYEWDFGDGGSSTEQNPTHTYTKTGTYTLTLTVINSLGVSSSSTKTVVVKPWAFYQKHILSSTTPLTDYQVKFTIFSGTGTSSGGSVYCNGNCNADFSDIRFSVDGEMVLPYWIESISSGTSATIWVRVPTITTSTDIYVYYGNDEVESASSGEDTFLLFDDFSSSELDTEKWSVTGATINTDGIQIFYAPSTSWVHLGSISTFGVNTAVRTRAKFLALASEKGSALGYRANGGTPYVQALYYNSASGSVFRAQDSSAASASTNTNTSYHVYEIGRAGSAAVRFFIDDTAATGSPITTSTAIPISAIPVSFQSVGGSSYGLNIDWIAVRTYADVEPSHGSWEIEVIISDYVVQTITPSSGLLPQTEITLAVKTNLPFVLTDWGDDTDDTTTPVGLHKYTEPGTYTITTNGYLTEGGDIEASDITEVTIGNHQFTVSISDETPDPNDPISYSLNHTYQTCLVDFGDGTTSTNATGTHAYQDPGTYVLTAMVYHATGETGGTITDTIVVNPHSLSLEVSPSAAIPHQEISCVVTSTYPTNTIDYGDGQVVDESVRSHAYESEGTYIVVVTGTDRFGKIGVTASQTITITNYPIAVSGLPGGTVLTGEELSLSITTDYPVIETDFGDGYSVLGASPVHTYSSSGEYVLTVSCSLANGLNRKVVSYNLIVVDGIRPVFSAKRVRGSAPLTVQFINDTVGIDFSYEWDFGDGTTSTDENPIHTYTSVQDYSVKLTATSNQYSSDIVKKNYIRVMNTDSPVSGFSTNLVDYSGIAPVAVRFTDLSSGSISSWLWDFGDGTTSTEQNPAHTYAIPGFYLVKQSVFNTEWEDESVSLLYIRSPLAVIILASVRTGYNPLPVLFRSMIDGPFTRLFWDFGDGTTSTEQNPAHTYVAAGTFTVTLTVWNKTVSYPTTATKTITVKDSTTIPVPEYSTDVTSGTGPLEVQFTDLSTGSISSWLWDFGDGTTSTEQHPTHTYVVAGTFTVKLTVRNADGVSDSEEKTGLITVLSKPSVSFGVDTDFGHTPLSVQFTDASLHSPTSWLWDFGDGTTSTEQNPAHTFSDIKSYWVTLTATNSLGSSSVGRDITVLHALAPIPSFTYQISGKNFPLTVDFTGVSGTSAEVTWFWDFGDGTTSTEQTPIHVYYHPGEYLVVLTVKNEYGEIQIKQRINNA